MTVPATPARRLRRVTAGVCLVAFPVLLIAQEFTNPLDAGDGADFYAVTSTSGSAFVPSALLLLLTGLLMAPAASGVLHQARDRGAALANAGAALLALGALAMVAEGALFLFAGALPGGDPAEMAAFIDRISENPAAGIAWTVLTVSWGLGMLVLPWAVLRAGAVHWWVPALATVAVLAEFLLPFRSTATELVVWAALTATFGTIGLRVLRMTDAEWDGVRAPVRAGDPVPA